MVCENCDIYYVYCCKKMDNDIGEMNIKSFIVDPSAGYFNPMTPDLHTTYFALSLIKQMTIFCKYQCNKLALFRIKLFEYFEIISKHLKIYLK